MVRYVLRRIEDGKYVAPLGQHHSYTRNLQKARVFASKEAAQADACGNETPVAICRGDDWRGE